MKTILLTGKDEPRGIGGAPIGVVPPRTTYTITGTLVGAYWWPIGQVWTKEAQRQYTRDSVAADRPFGPDLLLDVPRLHDYCSCGQADGQFSDHRPECRSERPQRLRLAMESLTRDGDSSERCKVAYGELSIRRDYGARETVRRFPLSMFPSIADYIMSDDDASEKMIGLGDDE